MCSIGQRFKSRDEKRAYRKGVRLLRRVAWDTYLSLNYPSDLDWHKYIDECDDAKDFVVWCKENGLFSTLKAYAEKKAGRNSDWWEMIEEFRTQGLWK
jgi:hypothetical protein